MVCWTPFYVVTLSRIYSAYQYTWTAAKSISLLMALSHSVVNPFLYVIFSTRAVRAAFVTSAKELRHAAASDSDMIASSVQFKSLFNNSSQRFLEEISLEPSAKLSVTYGRRAEMWWKGVPDDWSSDRKALSSKLGCSDSRHEQITSHSRMETRTAKDISHCVDDVTEVGWAAVPRTESKAKNNILNCIL